MCCYGVELDEAIAFSIEWFQEEVGHRSKMCLFKMYFLKAFFELFEILEAKVHV